LPNNKPEEGLNTQLQACRLDLKMKYGTILSRSSAPNQKKEVRNGTSRAIWSVDLSQLMPCLTAGQAKLKLDSYDWLKPKEGI
jgi:hypothetical protein